MVLDAVISPKESIEFTLGQAPVRSLVSVCLILFMKQLYHVNALTSKECMS